MRLSRTAADAAVDAVCSLLNGGFLRLYAGKRPRRPDDAPSWQPLLVELRFASPAFELAVGGSATATEMGAATAQATGRPSWFCTLTSVGVVVFDGSVGDGKGEWNIDQARIQKGATVKATKLVYTQLRKSPA